MCGPDEKKGPFADLRKLESNVSRALGFFHDKLKLGLKFAAAWEATLGHIRACVANERRKFRALPWPIARLRLENDRRKEQLFSSLRAHPIASSSPDQPCVRHSIGC